MAELKPVIFKLHGEKYGVDINLVMGIEREQRIVAVPNSPENIKGIINMRGIIVPVYNLAKKFGFADISDENSQLIITKIGEMMIAVEVEGVEEISEIPSSSISEAPILIKGGKTAYIKEIAKLGNDLIIILDVEELLSEEEQRDMEEFVKEQSA